MKQNKDQTPNSVLAHNERMETFIKVLLGEEVEQSEIDEYNAHNQKYAEVRRKYCEAKKEFSEDGKDYVLVDFHFTPGTDFMNISADEMVESLLKLDLDIKSGKVKSEKLNFDDLK